MLFCLTVHEAAHAWMAKRKGDDTAEQMGRLTLNPIPHVDIVGTVIFPLVGAFMMGGVLGWAKPVPVDLRNVKDPKWDHILIAAAGPMSNVLFGIICIFGTLVYTKFLYAPGHENALFYPLVGLLRAMVYVNAILALFNMIPLPPLDGATVIGAILPHDLANKYEEFVAPYGFMILLLLFMTGGLSWIWPVAKMGIGVVTYGLSILLGCEGGVCI